MGEKSMNYSQKKHTAVFIIFTVLLVTGLICASVVYAAEPGSNDDPIALKSYVDTKLNALEKKLSANKSSTETGADLTSLTTKLEDLSKKVDQLTAENKALRTEILQAGSITGEDGSNGDAGTVAASAGYPVYKIYEVKSGERVLLGASTEMVIRTGKAQAIRGEFGGVIDLISGEELSASAEVALNHLLLAARKDGRGVRFTENAFVMIKGEFDLR